MLAAAERFSQKLSDALSRRQKSHHSLAPFSLDCFTHCCQFVPWQTLRKVMRPYFLIITLAMLMERTQTPTQFVNNNNHTDFMLPQNFARSHTEEIKLMTRLNAPSNYAGVMGYTCYTDGPRLFHQAARPKRIPKVVERIDRQRDKINERISREGLQPAIAFGSEHQLVPYSHELQQGRYGARFNFEFIEGRQPRIHLEIVNVRNQKSLGVHEVHSDVVKQLLELSSFAIRADAMKQEPAGLCQEINDSFGFQLLKSLFNSKNYAQYGVKYFHKVILDHPLDSHGLFVLNVPPDKIDNIRDWPDQAVVLDPYAHIADPNSAIYTMAEARANPTNPVYSTIMNCIDHWKVYSHDLLKLLVSPPGTTPEVQKDYQEELRHRIFK